MKYILFFFCSLLSAEELLVTALMVKNEAHSIEDTLEPLVKGGITSYYIYDTGSTDETLAVVDRFFKKHPEVKGVIKQEPFIDFASSRNRALDLAKGAFPKAEFILMPDAEWILENPPALLEFCRQESKTSPTSYLVKVKGGADRLLLNADYSGKGWCALLWKSARSRRANLHGESAGHLLFQSKGL